MQDDKKEDKNGKNEEEGKKEVNETKEEKKEPKPITIKEPIQADSILVDLPDPTKEKITESKKL